MCNSTICKSIILGVCCFCFGSMAVAHNAVKLTQDDSTETIFLLGDRPQVTIDGNMLTITTYSDMIDVPIGEGARFDFLDYETSSVNAIGEQAVVRLLPNMLSALNITPNSPVALTDISGKKVLSIHTDNKGNVNIDLSSLAPGVYVFNSKDKNFKFYKK